MIPSGAVVRSLKQCRGKGFGVWEVCFDTSFLHQIDPKRNDSPYTCFLSHLVIFGPKTLCNSSLGFQLLLGLLIFLLLPQSHLCSQRR